MLSAARTRTRARTPARTRTRTRATKDKGKLRQLMMTDFLQPCSPGVAVITESQGDTRLRAELMSFVATLERSRGEQGETPSRTALSTPADEAPSSLALAASQGSVGCAELMDIDQLHVARTSFDTTLERCRRQLVETPTHTAFSRQEPPPTPALVSPVMMTHVTNNEEIEEASQLLRGTGTVYERVWVYKWPTNVVRIDRNVVDVSLEVATDMDEEERCGCGETCTRTCPNYLSYFLCNENNCGALGDCGNRFIEHYRLEVVHSSVGGGVCCMTDIPKGSFVLEYVGELIDELEFRERSDVSYVVRLKAKTTTGESLYLDAGKFGNKARFVNHSCRPNCVLEEYRWKGYIRLGIFAKENLKPMQELTFHYHSTALPFQCRCGQSCYVNASS
ncbi:hypothetical protein DVH05_003021 [Phytophthora capsici]|nr:hypothetical protein DVH05_003021 [Phytophthora capsici]